MREIKFRAWFTRDEKYIKPMSLQNMIHQKVSTFSLSVLYNEVIFEQYTGLKDKNGVEIYEGDIVKFVSEISDFKTIARVIYLEDLAAFTFNTGDINYTPEDRYEVIGNIHENPELLEVD